MNKYIIALLLPLFLSGCNQDTPALEKQTVRPVKLFEVQDPQLAQIHHFPGRVVPSESAELSFRVSGKLSWLKNRAGSKVKKGEVLARIESMDAMNEYKNRKANFDLAQVEFVRNQQIFNKGLISRAILDQSSAELRSAEAKLAAAKDNLAYTELTAPFDGVITQIKVENHQYVMARDPILLLENRDYIDISIEVPERFIANLANNPNPNNYQSEVTFSALPNQTFMVDFKEAASTPTPGSQTYTIVTTMPKPKNIRLQQGMTAVLTVDFAKLSTITPTQLYTLVPISSIQYTNDKPAQAYVWHYDKTSHQVSRYQVTLGTVSQRGVELTSGVQAGDLIVVAGGHQLLQGQIVKPWEKERGL